MVVQEGIVCNGWQTLTYPHSSEFYEANALMMEEEGAVIAGLLVGLNVIDANLCMKGEDLDSQVMNMANGHQWQC